LRPRCTTQRNIIRLSVMERGATRLCGRGLAWPMWSGNARRQAILWECRIQRSGPQASVLREGNNGLVGKDQQSSAAAKRVVSRRSPADASWTVSNPQKPGVAAWKGMAGPLPVDGLQSQMRMREIMHSGRRANSSPGADIGGCCNPPKAPTRPQDAKRRWSSDF
jgi:hypothetical protein